MRRLIYFVLLIFILSNCLGCDAFVRKFTRKRKKVKEVEEVVFVPKDYPDNPMTPEQLYRQYLLFWKSWQDELIESFNRKASHKKQLSCADEAIKNLNALKAMLLEDKAAELDKLIKRMGSLRDNIANDVYSARLVQNKSRAEVIKREVLRYFAFADVRNSLK